MSKVKQWATDEAEKAVDKILSEVKSNIMSIDIARNKILAVNNVNLTGIDEFNVDEVIAENI
jgi:hypothetical protein|tara:strand:- start:692 stop:877 length:186 start_codon:yes stop_codon:yes gene_type:complete